MKTKTYFLSVILVGVICFAGGALANKTSTLNPKTKQNLMTAMKGEAFARAKYMLYAQNARLNGNTEVAELFEKTANVERFEHFTQEAKLVGLVGDDNVNLKDAIGGESYEVETMYRDFAKQAKAVGDKAAAALFEEIRKDEAGHRDEFKAALEKLTSKPASGQ